MSKVIYLPGDRLRFIFFRVGWRRGGLGLFFGERSVTVYAGPILIDVYRVRRDRQQDRRARVRQ